jgi:hypothetical protein
MDTKTTVLTPTKQGRRMRARLTAALLGSTMLTLLGAGSAKAVVETEDNSTFPGQAALTATLYTGSTDDSVVPFNIDFFDFSGLTSGDQFDFTVVGIDFSLQFALYTDQTTFSGAVTESSGATGHIAGTVPGGGELVLGVSVSGGAFERYSLRLDITPQGQVPEPASAALLAAGLGVLGMVRRRKRR